PTARPNAHSVRSSRAPRPPVTRFRRREDMRGTRPRLAGGRPFSIVAFAALGTLTISAVAPNQSEFADPAGTVSTYNKLGSIDTTNPFFQSLGTNGRACSTCHLLSDGVSLSSASAHTLF